MDGVFLSHLTFWLIGAMSVISVVLAIGAMMAMGRTAYRKD